jgi:glycosyltransferase involved in cell wall biosynthesis
LIIIACAEACDSALKTSKHHLVTSFISRGIKVCYVEVPRNILICLWGIVTFSRHKFFVVDGNMINFRPISIFPNSKKIGGIFDNRFFFIINNFFLDIQFKFLLRKLRSPSFKFICYLPIGTKSLQKEANETVLHVVDEWDGLDTISTCLKNEIRKYFCTSDKVIFASNILKKQFFDKISHRANTLVLNHGLAFDPQGHALKGVVSRKLNLDQQNIRIGYYGAFSKLDLNLLLSTVKALPKYNFILVGPKNDLLNNLEYKKLKNQLLSTKNLSFEGSVLHQEIPNFVEKINVLWLPFKKNQLTEKMSPIKVYEGLSLGVPIVSSLLEGIYEIGQDKILYGNSWQEHKKALIQCINYKSIELSYEHSRSMKVSSWSKISQDFLGDSK